MWLWQAVRGWSITVFRFPKSPWLQRDSDTGLIYVAQTSWDGCDLPRPLAHPQQNVTWCIYVHVIALSITPLSIASTNLGKYVFSSYKLFTFKHHFWTAFLRDEKALPGSYERVGLWDFSLTPPTEQLCFYLFYVLVFWMGLFCLFFKDSILPEWKVFRVSKMIKMGLGPQHRHHLQCK